MKGPTKPRKGSKSSLFSYAFPVILGSFLGLTLLKFGNPPILEEYVTSPQNPYEFLLATPWPIAWAYVLASLVVIFGCLASNWAWNGPGWLLVLPFVWLGWQFLAGLQSIDHRLSQPTLAHFTVCAACFIVGYFCLGQNENLASFWFPILCGFLVMLAVGWEQHFGGLEATRKYFLLYVMPQLKEVPPEYLGKISSNRIFATLFYPNALAGALLLLLPVLLGSISAMKNSLTPGARAFLIVVVSLASIGCLYWSGSKGGWLLMLLLGVVAVLKLNLPRGFKVGVVAVVLAVGLAGFFLKYAIFFKKGATSVSARIDYWQAAAKVAVDQPFFGTGPGTFSIPYSRLKRPDAEMSRLVHNDYLQQASDSGLPGFLAYGLFVLGAISWTGVRVWSGSGPATRPQVPVPQNVDGRARSADRELTNLSTFERLSKKVGRILPSVGWENFLIWLGLLGWALQSFFEFGLYLPAISWPAFALMGLLLSRVARTEADLNRIDKR